MSSIVRDIIGRASVDRIVKGGDYDIAVQLFDRLTKEPLNLDGASGGQAEFQGVDGTLTVEWSASGVSVLDADVGFVRVRVPAALSAQLAAGEGMSWELQVDHGPTTIVQFVQGLDVDDQLY